MDATEILFLAQIGTIIAFVVTLFVLYRILVQQKDATIDLLKVSNTQLKNQLEDARNQSPDLLAESLARRVRTFETELKRLEGDKSSSEDEVQAKEDDLMRAREEAESLTKKILSAQNQLSDFLCPHCKAPLAEKAYHSEIVEYKGREIDIDHDYSVFECGYEIIDGKIRTECGETAEKVNSKFSQG